MEPTEPRAASSFLRRSIRRGNAHRNSLPVGTPPGMMLPGIGPASAPKMGATEWKRPAELDLAGVASAEHFVHAKRSLSERIHATQSVRDAQRYIREAYAVGIEFPCLSKRGMDCVPSRRKKA